MLQKYVDTKTAMIVITNTRYAHYDLMTTLNMTVFCPVLGNKKKTASYLSIICYGYDIKSPCTKAHFYVPCTVANKTPVS